MLSADAVEVTREEMATTEGRFEVSKTNEAAAKPQDTISLSATSEESVEIYMNAKTDFQKHSIFETFADYKGGIVPNPEDKKKTPSLGTILGVYFPCIQNIIGVIVFIRLPWIIGVAGILQALLIVCLCCTCTLLTSISMSAIATNGEVPAGGSYFMISRSLGPEFGGAVGILFYLANSLSAAMYTVGAIEILIKYICPTECRLFGDDVEIPSVAFNHVRLYGTILLILLCGIVLIGIRFVSLLSPVSLFCVLFSILCIYIGLIRAAFFIPDAPVCVVDKLHLIKSNVLNNSVKQHCYPDDTLFSEIACRNFSKGLCPYLNSSVILPGVPGLRQSQIIKNLYSDYRKPGEVSRGVAPLDKELEVLAQEATSFLILIGIYFPSVTGIMAGSNRSGDLRNAAKSIPRGTIGAIVTTSTIYITYVLLVGSSIRGILLRDKFGDSIQKKLVISIIAWPSKWVIMIGAFLSTVGAGLQTLTGAPRILQALAMDDVIPFLHMFGKISSKGEPRRAVFLTAFIALLGVLIADLDKLTPLLSMFFLLCYGFVNLACALQSLLRAPNWRPKFRFYHWTLSIFGLALCVVIMFMVSWYYALTAIVIATLVYKYVEYKGAEKEWGDGITGLQMSAARYALTHLEEKHVHSKNWRPELLLLISHSENLTLKQEKLYAFVRQLKAGGGLVIVSSLIPTFDYVSKLSLEKVDAVHNAIKKNLTSFKIKGFVNILLTRSLLDGLAQLVQNTGLGGMRPNMLVMCWPNLWNERIEDEDPQALTINTFLHTLRLAEMRGLALLVPKNIEKFPKKDDITNKSLNIDVWWILHDAGLMLLIAHLLKKHKLWRKCSLRLFAVSENEQEASIAKNSIEKFMYKVRIPFESVEVIVLEQSDISAYAYERTLKAEQGAKLLSELQHQRQEMTDFQFTFTAQSKSKADNRSHVAKRIHSAIRLNEAIVHNSKESALIIVNLPQLPKSKTGEYSYMEYIEVLTENLGPLLLVRGTGSELITSAN